MLNPLHCIILHAVNVIWFSNSSLNVSLCSSTNTVIIISNNCCRLTLTLIIRLWRILIDIEYCYKIIDNKNYSVVKTSIGLFSPFDQKCSYCASKTIMIVSLRVCFFQTAMSISWIKLHIFCIAIAHSKILTYVQARNIRNIRKYIIL